MIRGKKYIGNICIGLSGFFCVMYFFSLFFGGITLRIAILYSLLVGVSYSKCSPKVRRLYRSVHGLGVILSSFIFLLLFYSGGRYKAVSGSYQEDVYASPKSVMILATHPDDELNLAAGVIESYRKNQIPVQVTFVSNGDATLGKSYRLYEALDSLETLGVYGEQVFFLGYGDQYQAPYEGIHKAPKDEILVSQGGYSQTYGIDSHPDFRSGKSGVSSTYTRGNLKKDIKQLLTEQKPSVIYAIDQDGHMDHQSTSEIFDEVMGELLKEDQTYKPRIYKGFGYSTAWTADKDYYRKNALSTKMPYESGRMEEVNYYLWDARTRFPVNPESLAYTCRGSQLYSAFLSHRTQKSLERMTGVVNGDKVFWRRPSESILYSANINAPDGNAIDVLNDFVLGKEEKQLWQGCEGDILTVTFDSPRNVSRLVFYDNPSLESNVLKLRITLDTDEIFDIENLDIGGSGTFLEIPHAPLLEGFQVEILAVEGDHPGLCEIEAYKEIPKEIPYIKLVDQGDQFLYTYTPLKKEDIYFGVYASNSELKALTKDLGKYYIATADGENLDIVNGQFCLEVPKVETTVRLSLKQDERIYDEIVVKPYSAVRNKYISGIQGLDKMHSSFSMWIHYYMARIHAIWK